MTEDRDELISSIYGTEPGDAMHGALVQHWPDEPIKGPPGSPADFDAWIAGYVTDLRLSAALTTHWTAAAERATARLDADQAHYRNHRRRITARRPNTHRRSTT